MKDLLTLFASVKVIKLFGEVFSYLLRSIFKYWWSFIIIASPITILLYKYGSSIFLSHYLLITGFCFVLSSIPGFVLGLRKDLKVKNYRLTTDCLIINECLIIKNNEYIDLDIDSQDIILKLRQEMSYIRQHFSSFKMPFLTILLPSHNRIFYLLKDIVKLKQFLLKEIIFNNILASLLIIKKETTKTIEFDVIHIPIPQFDIINNFIATFSNLNIKNEGFHKDYIIEVTKIFISIYATGSINLHEIEEQHKILDDNRKIMLSALDNSNYRQNTT